MFCTACGSPHTSTHRFCADCGARLNESSTPAAAAAPFAERRNLSIMFADLTNFTGLSTTLDAEDLHAIVSSYLQHITTTVRAHGGTVERYIGDSVMAVFGAPVAHGDDALRAVHAALAIQSQVMPELSRQCGRALQASIGISFGEVMFSQNSLDHPDGIAVVGESVNLASRVQGQAAAGSILVTDQMRSACGPKIQFEFSTEATLKGITKPVKLYRVLGLAIPENTARKRLIGRDKELKVLRHVVARCTSQSRGAIVHLRGEPGIGKSHLLEEFLALSQNAGLVVHTSAYLDFGLEQTRSGISAIVASLLGMTAADGADARHAIIVRAIETRLLNAEDAPFAADVLGLAPRNLSDRALLDAMTPAARQAAAHSVVLKLVAQAAKHQALILILEDIHWMPASEVPQLIALCELVRTSPLIVATTSRLTHDPLTPYLSGLNDPDLALSLDIGPISQADAQEIARQFSSSSQPWVDACIAQADGNPLFLDQLLRHATESGTNTVPGSINNVVLARLDQLKVMDRWAVQCASVIGQRFLLHLLQRLMPDQTYDLASLIQANIVKNHGTDWHFTHSLVQDGAYRSLLHSTARALHLDAAAYYRTVDLVLCAQHLERAKDPGASRAYLDAASEQLASFHFERARELLARGIELATTAQDRVHLLLIDGRALHDQGLIADSLQRYTQALAEADEPAQQCRAWLGQAMCKRVTDDLDGAFHALAQAQPLAQQANLTAELGELHYLRGSLHFPRGELDECLHEHGQALAFAQQTGSALDEARALSGLGDAYYARSRMRTAHGHFDRCMTLCGAHGLGRIEAANRFMVATVRMYMNELDTALDDALQAAELARRVGHQRAQIVSRLTAGWIYLLQARPDQAEQQVNLGLEVTQALGAPRFRAFLLESVARVKLAAGDFSGAMAAIDEALALVQSLNLTRFIGPWILGTRALVSQDIDLSRASLAQGQALIDAGCVGHNYFWFYKHAMQTCLGHGDLTAAEAYAQRLQDHTAAEPTPWGDLFIERTRVLALLLRDAQSTDGLARARPLAQMIEKTGHHEAAQGLPFNIP